MQFTSVVRGSVNARQRFRVLHQVILELKLQGQNLNCQLQLDLEVVRTVPQYMLRSCRLSQYV
jgi:hypothetical protein